MNCLMALESPWRHLDGRVYPGDSLSVVIGAPGCVTVPSGPAADDDNNEAGGRRESPDATARAE